jgi:tetratricopeptide (TPR) repeat protein
MPKPQRGRTREPQRPSAAGPPAELAQNASNNVLDSNAARSSGPPGRRPTYPEAVARYEHGMRAFQERRFADAADAFRAILSQYPEEKELADRVRVYLLACERQVRTDATEPRTLEERLYAATLALNAGKVDDAMRHLTAVVAQDPNHDGALYMLGVVHALREEAAAAVSYLQRAIEQNPENRALALQDSDLERLLQDGSIRAVLEAAGGGAADARRPGPRSRTLR